MGRVNKKALYWSMMKIYPQMIIPSPIKQCIKMVMEPQNPFIADNISKKKQSYHKKCVHVMARFFSIPHITTHIRSPDVLHHKMSFNLKSGFPQWEHKLGLWETKPNKLCNVSNHHEVSSFRDSAAVILRRCILSCKIKNIFIANLLYKTHKTYLYVISSIPWCPN